MSLLTLAGTTPRRRTTRQALTLSRRRAAAVLVVLALTWTAGAVVSASASGAQDKAHLRPVPAVVWPSDADGGKGFTAVVDVYAAGEYSFQISRDESASVIAKHSLGHVEPGTYTWEWDGRHTDGELPKSGPHTLEFYGSSDDGHYYYDVEEWVGFSVRYSTETVSLTDRRREPDSRHVDVSTFSLTNAPRGVTLTYRFRELRVAALPSLTAGLDVNRFRRGYLVTSTKTKSGWRETVRLAVLNSDEGTPERVGCPGARTRIKGRAAVITVPRNCLRHGGRSVRGEWWVGDKHYHGDYVEYPDVGWTSWATYAVPPA